MTSNQRSRVSPPAIVSIATAAIAVWSLLFLPTFHNPLHWDDYHFIRPYTSHEIASVFHGWNDPDHIETAAYRPLATLFFAAVGLLGDHTVAIRIASVLVMWVFLVVAGFLLAAFNLSTLEAALMLGLLASSRVFACLALWTTAGNMAVCYIAMMLAAVFLLAFARTGRPRDFVCLIVCTCAAVLTREEAYVLPLLFPLLVLAAGDDVRDRWRRVALASGAAALLVIVHRTLSRMFVPQVGSIRLSALGVRRWLMAVRASWMPGGLAVGRSPITLVAAILWIAFVLVIFLAAFRSSAIARWLSVFAIAGVLCLPALAVPRAFGIVLPQLACIALVVIAAVRFGNSFNRLAIGFVVCGLLIGAASGIRRSLFVAEAMRPDCAPRAARDAEMIFDMYPHPVTIPPARLHEARVRLAAYGLRSPADVEALRTNIRSGRVPRGLFLPQYDYLLY